MKLLSSDAIIWKIAQLHESFIFERRVGTLISGSKLKEADAS